MTASRPSPTRPLACLTLLTIAVVCARAAYDDVNSIRFDRPDEFELEADEFEVEFATSATLGLSLDPSLTIKSFKRSQRGEKQAGEKSGWLKIGDKLTHVNDVSVSRLGLASASRVIAKAELPKVLRFRARNKEHRRDAVSVFQSGVGNLTDATGRMELLMDGLPSGHLPFVRAMFGGNTSCSRARVAIAQPMSGCTAFSNEQELANAIVVVRRGDCSFSAKALNLQDANAFAMVVINDEGAAIRMPGDAIQSAGVFIPAVMLSEGDEDTLDTLLKTHHHTPIIARLAATGGSCETHSVKAEKLEAEAQAKAQQEAEEKQKRVEANEATLRTELEALADFNHWPEDDRARRRLFHRLSRIHHPDKGGSFERMAALTEAFMAANKLYGEA